MISMGMVDYVDQFSADAWVGLSKCASFTCQHLLLKELVNAWPVESLFDKRGRPITSLMAKIGVQSFENLIP